MDDSEDPVMPRVREWLEASGLSQHDLGAKMGYSDDVARKAVWQFLRSKDPRIGMLRRFATAAGMTIEELVGERKPARRKK
jgi:transcriptional regulator with XRE-family HTH domain